jgi:hypothetical protein
MGERISTYLVTHFGNFVCDVAEEDVNKLSVREPGTYVTLYNLINPETSKLIDEERIIETSSIVSRLY